MNIGKIFVVDITYLFIGSMTTIIVIPLWDLNHFQLHIIIY